jgi:hypothetical protein
MLRGTQESNTERSEMIIDIRTFVVICLLSLLTIGCAENKTPQLTKDEYINARWTWAYKQTGEPPEDSEYNLAPFSANYEAATGTGYIAKYDFPTKIQSETTWGRPSVRESNVLDDVTYIYRIKTTIGNNCNIYMAWDGPHKCGNSWDFTEEAARQKKWVPVNGTIIEQLSVKHAGFPSVEDEAIYNEHERYRKDSKDWRDRFDKHSDKYDEDHAEEYDRFFWPEF